MMEKSLSKGLDGCLQVFALMNNFHVTACLPEPAAVVLQMTGSLPAGFAASTLSEQPASAFQFPAAHKRSVSAVSAAQSRPVQSPRSQRHGCYRRRRRIRRRRIKWRHTHTKDSDCAETCHCAIGFGHLAGLVRAGRCLQSTMGQNSVSAAAHTTSLQLALMNSSQKAGTLPQKRRA